MNKTKKKKKSFSNNEPPVPLYLDEKNGERSPVCSRNFQATMCQLADMYTWTKREPFRVEFSWHRERVVTVESRLILERGYPGGRGGYLGHDQVAINIASRRRSLHRTQPDAPFALRNGNRYRRGRLSEILNPIEMSNLIDRRRARVPIFSFTSLASVISDTR